MAIVKLELSGKPVDGQHVTFKAPCDCTVVTGLRTYYAESGEKKSMTFTMKDSHNNDLTGIGNLFGEGSLVEAVLNVTDGVAHLLNAANNGYLDHRLKVREVTLSSSGWSDTIPYTQVVSIEDISENDRPEICVGTPRELSASAYKALNKAFGMIDRAVTVSGGVEFYCYSKKPTVDIPVIVKGA